MAAAECERNLNGRAGQAASRLPAPISARAAARVKIIFILNCSPRAALVDVFPVVLPFIGLACLREGGFEVSYLQLQLHLLTVVYEETDKRARETPRERRVRARALVLVYLLHT